MYHQYSKYKSWLPLVPGCRVYDELWTPCFCSGGNVAIVGLEKTRTQRTNNFNGMRLDGGNPAYVFLGNRPPQHEELSVAGTRKYLGIHTHGIRSDRLHIDSWAMALIDLQLPLQRVECALHEDPERNQFHFLSELNGVWRLCPRRRTLYRGVQRLVPRVHYHVFPH